MMYEHAMPLSGPQLVQCSAAWDNIASYPIAVGPRSHASQPLACSASAPSSPRATSPVMVCVLPAPVWPYTKMEELKPAEVRVVRELWAWQHSVKAGSSGSGSGSSSKVLRRHTPQQHAPGAQRLEINSTLLTCHAVLHHLGAHSCVHLLLACRRPKHACERGQRQLGRVTKPRRNLAVWGATNSTTRRREA